MRRRVEFSPQFLSNAILTGFLAMFLVIVSGCSGLGDEGADGTETSRQSGGAGEDDGSVEQLTVTCDETPEDRVLEGEVALTPAAQQADGSEVTRYVYKIDVPSQEFRLEPHAGDERLAAITFGRLGGSERDSLTTLEFPDRPDVSVQTSRSSIPGETTTHELRTSLFRKSDTERGLQWNIVRKKPAAGGEWTVESAHLVAGRLTADREGLTEDQKSTFEIVFADDSIQNEGELRSWARQQGVDEVFDGLVRTAELFEPIGSQRALRDFGEGFAGCYADARAGEESRIASTTQALTHTGVCEEYKKGDEQLRKVSWLVGAAGCVIGAGIAIGTYGVGIGAFLVGCGLGGGAGALAGELIGAIAPGPFESIASKMGCDPYTQTADGLAYEFQGAGEFIWARRREGSSFEVQVRQTPNVPTACGRFSQVTAVAASVGGHRVRFDRDGPVLLRIDGESRDGSKYFWRLGDAGHVQRSPKTSDEPGQYLVEWYSGERLRVLVFENRFDLELEIPEEGRDGLEGLIGDGNGDSTDDIRLRDGTLLEEPVQWRDLYAKFVESWRVRPGERLFDGSIGPSADREFPRGPVTLEDLTAEQIAHGRRLCRERGGIANPTVLEHCVVDVGCSRDDSYVTTYARWDGPVRPLEIVYPDGNSSSSLSPTGDATFGEPEGAVTRHYAACGEAKGDPHLRTMDGIAFDFQAAGEFIYLRSRAEDSFEIQARQEPVGLNKCPGVTLVSAVAASVGEHRVGIYARRDEKLWIDGVPVDLTAGFRMLGDGRSVLHPEEDVYVVRWSQGEVLVANVRGTRMGVTVDVPDTRRGQVEGVLGRFNGEGEDDVVIRDGPVLEEPIDWDTLYGAYADSWRVTSDESLFDYESGNDTTTYTDKSVPGRPTDLETIPDAERASARQTCEDAGLTNQSILQDCIIDVYCTGDESYTRDHVGREEPEGDLDVETPIFLDGWSQEGPLDHGSWTVTSDGRTVRQQTNGDPTFYVSAKNYIDTTLEGSLTVDSSDDDYIGFVFGYRKPLSAQGDDPEDVDFLLFAWKQRDQSGALEGMTLARVTQWPQDGWPEDAFWNQEPEPGYEILATKYGDDLGWRDEQKHRFALRYTSKNIDIFIDGVEVFSVDSSQVGGDFPAGRFGFYNYSQSRVEYTDFSSRSVAATLLPSAFEFDNFGDTSEVRLVGETSRVGGLLRLAAARDDQPQAGAVWHAAKPNVGAGFTTSFDFRLTAPTSCNGMTQARGDDGLALVIHDAPTTWETIGEPGPGLGYEGITTSVAVEFDTSQDGTKGDPNDNHVSIHHRPGTNATNSSEHKHALATGTANLPDFADGLRHTAEVVYTPDPANPAGSVLRVFVDDSSSPAVEANIDLNESLELRDGQAFVGLTAGASCAEQNHDLLSWRFQSK